MKPIAQFNHRSIHIPIPRIFSKIKKGYTFSCRIKAGKGIVLGFRRKRNSQSNFALEIVVNRVSLGYRVVEAPLLSLRSFPRCAGLEHLQPFVGVLLLFQSQFGGHGCWLHGHSQHLDPGKIQFEGLQLAQQTGLKKITGKWICTTLTCRFTEIRGNHGPIFEFQRAIV